MRFRSSRKEEGQGERGQERKESGTSEEREKKSTRTGVSGARRGRRRGSTKVESEINDKGWEEGGTARVNQQAN